MSTCFHHSVLLFYFCSIISLLHFFNPPSPRSVLPLVLLSCVFLLFCCSVSNFFLFICFFITPSVSVSIHRLLRLAISLLSCCWRPSPLWFFAIASLYCSIFRPIVTSIYPCLCFSVFLSLHPIVSRSHHIFFSPSRCKINVLTFERDETLLYCINKQLFWFIVARSL